MFPRWVNYLLPLLILGAVGGAIYVPTLFATGASPKTLAVGYSPDQPIPYSHAVHVGKLGLDCRYCHTTVENAAFAAIPPTQTCMNCHSSVKTDSPKLAPLFESWKSGEPVPWVKVHDLPDYVYFNHSAHVTHGVGCAECHGRVDRMDEVKLEKPLSMGWCLECHRAPEKFIRPADQVTNMDYKTGDEAAGKELEKKYGVHSAAYMTSCSTCHR